MGKIINVTAANVDLCTDALGDLRLHLEELARLTKDYPVECSFCTYTFLFESRQDILNLIDSLSRKIDDYRKAA
jgi:hypothetical protein